MVNPGLTTLPARCDQSARPILTSVRQFTLQITIVNLQQIHTMVI